MNTQKIKRENEMRQAIDESFQIFESNKFSINEVLAILDQMKMLVINVAKELDKQQETPHGDC